jgi:hypothetical protein
MCAVGLAVLMLPMLSVYTLTDKLQAVLVLAAALAASLHVAEHCRGNSNSRNRLNTSSSMHAAGPGWNLPVN